MDALAHTTDEGRGLPPKRVGEPESGCDPTISEWGNPTTVMGGDPVVNL